MAIASLMQMMKRAIYTDDVRDVRAMETVHEQMMGANVQATEVLANEMGKW